MPQNSDTVLQTLLCDMDSIVLLWEYESGWQILKGGCAGINPDGYKDEGIFDLLPYISPEDESVFREFLQETRIRMKGKTAAKQIDKAIFEAAFHIKTVSDMEGFFKFTVFQHADDERFADSILILIKEVDAQESYRYNLAKNITNDNNPETFNQQVRLLFEKNPGENYAVIQFDVAKFKMINQQFGEAFGDEMLEFFINTLKYTCSKDQLCVRLTADVFMVLTPYKDKEDILSFIEVLRERLLNYKGANYRLVFGVNYVEDKTRPLRVYGDGAAFARQSIKNNALLYVAFFKEEMTERVIKNKWVEDRMERALENHEFKMYLQPKYNIENEQIVGAEALVRWIEPQKGIIYPIDFIPLFEENGFIIKLDRYMWEEACKKISAWKKEGKKLIPISVNMSRRHMNNDDYLNFLDGLIQKYQIDKSLLEIEITETVDDGKVDAGVSILKEHGYTLLMDDFGSGYSSLNMLKDTQFDILKIDRAFLNNFIESDRGKSIVEHTITMSRDIGLDIVAEGVENKDQAEFLSKCGCDIAQGYYYAKPMPVEEFDAIYENSCSK